MNKIVIALSLMLPFALYSHAHADSGSGSGSSASAAPAGSGSSAAVTPTSPPTPGVATSPGATDGSGSGSASGSFKAPTVGDPTNINTDKSLITDYGVWGLMALIGALCMWAVVFSEKEGWLSNNSKPILILTAVGGVLTSLIASKYGDAPWMAFFATLVMAAKTVYAAFHAGATKQANAIAKAA